MYFYFETLKDLTGEEVVLIPGDELVQSGLPNHKMTFVGPVGMNGENVVDPAKGQAARLIHLQSIPNWQRLQVGARGPEDLYAQMEVQRRAIDVVQRCIVNRTFGPNCEHISSYIRKGKPESPQLTIAAGIGVAAVALACLFGG